MKLKITFKQNGEFIEGDFVRWSDHERKVSAMQEEIERLKNQTISLNKETTALRIEKVSLYNKLEFYQERFKENLREIAKEIKDKDHESEQHS